MIQQSVLTPAIKLADKALVHADSTTVVAASILKADRPFANPGRIHMAGD